MRPPAPDVEATACNDCGAPVGQLCTDDCPTVLSFEQLQTACSRPPDLDTLWRLYVGLGGTRLVRHPASARVSPAVFPREPEAGLDAWARDPAGVGADAIPAAGPAAGAGRDVQGVELPPGEVWGGWSGDGRLKAEVVAVDDRALEVEFRLRPDLVEVTRGGLVQACVDRDVLASWLAELSDGVSVQDLTYDEVTLSAGPHGRVALSVAGDPRHVPIQQWELSPQETAALHERI